MRATLLLLLIIGSLRTAEAQALRKPNGSQIRNGPVSTKDLVEYQLRNMTESQAETTIIRMRVDNSPSNSIPYSTLPTPNDCVKEKSYYTCTNPIPQAMVDRINAKGTHKVYVYAFNSKNGESAPSDSWTITTK